MDLRLDTIVVRRADVLAQPVDDEMVMMALESNKYYGLNPMGRRIWEMLEQPTTVAAICAQLVRDYDVTPEQCAAEVIAFLADLMRDGTVAIQGGTAP